MTALQRVSLHEAGHAIVMIAAGEHVLEAHVRRSLACDGVCARDPAGPLAAGLAAAAIAVAGTVAERMADAGWPAPTARAGAWYFAQTFTAPSDRDRAARQHAASGASRYDDVTALATTGVAAGDAERHAAAVLAARWAAVVRVADRLIERGRLDGAEIHALAGQQMLTVRS